MDAAWASDQTVGADSHRDSRIFFWVSPELFSRFRDYIGRPTHDRLVALRQTGRIPREGKKGGGTTWPASFFTFTSLISPSHKLLCARCVQFPRDPSEQPSPLQWICMLPA